MNSQFPALNKPFLALYLSSCRLFPRSLRRRYARLFSLKLGSYKFVVAGSSEAVREVLVTRSAQFGGRPKTHSLEMFSQGKYCPVLFLALRGRRLRIKHNFIESRARTGASFVLSILYMHRSMMSNGGILVQTLAFQSVDLSFGKPISCHTLESEKLRRQCSDKIGTPILWPLGYKMLLTDYKNVAMTIVMFMTPFQPRKRNWDSLSF